MERKSGTGDTSERIDWGFVEARQRLGMGFVRLADTIHESCEGKLGLVLEERSKRPHLYTEEGCEAEVRGYWREFLHAVDELLTRGFRSLVDAAVDPKFAQGRLPSPAEFAYQHIDVYYTVIKRNAGLRIVPLVLTLDSGQTNESLSAEFEAINHHLMNRRRAAFRKQAAVHSADLSDPPLPQPTAEHVESLTTLKPACRLGLADLSDPPHGMSKHQVVNELVGLLRDTIKKARSLVDEGTTKGNEVSPKDIAERFLLLKDATPKEIRECVFEGRHISASEAAFELMRQRTGVSKVETMKSYAYKSPKRKKF